MPQAAGSTAPQVAQAAGNTAPQIAGHTAPAAAPAAVQDSGTMDVSVTTAEKRLPTTFSEGTSGPQQCTPCRDLRLAITEMD